MYCQTPLFYNTLNCWHIIDFLQVLFKCQWVLILLLTFILQFFIILFIIICGLHPCSQPTQYFFVNFIPLVLLVNWIITGLLEHVCNILAYFIHFFYLFLIISLKEHSLFVKHLFHVYKTVTKQCFFCTYFSFLLCYKNLSMFECILPTASALNISNMQPVPGVYLT